MAARKQAAAKLNLYLVHVDGDVNENVDEVTQGQAGNESIGPIPHALVLVYNPQEGGVSDQADHEDCNGNDGVDVLKIVADGGRCEAARRWHWPFYNSFIGKAGF